MNISSITAAAVSNALERFGAAAETLSAAADPSNPVDIVDFSAAAVELSAAKVDVAASVRVFRAEQEIMQHTLDLLA